MFALAIALLATACGGGAGSYSSGSSPSSAASPAAAATVKTATKTVAGKSQSILVDTKGLSLYRFAPDSEGKVTCLSACAKNWPPLRLEAGTTQPAAGPGVPGQLGTIANPEGGTQVTYNGWPLYHYAKDKDSGDTYGEGVGGKWFAVTPNVAPGASPSAGSGY
ncbi:MAG: hypothetical protein M3072_08550 [Candidatus Dormibacteraeota bacterium]|nr:hypothetical protein [Candidatus Dormibacteraeota bacterium]